MKAVLMFAVACTTAGAAVLDFPNNICSAVSAGTGAFTACSNGSFINQAYGDAAGVDVTYSDLINVGSSLRWWDTGYNNLQGVAWGGNGDADGASWDRIAIVPTAGGSIILNGFDLGAWPNAVKTTHLRVLDALTSAVLIDFGAPTIGTGNVANHFSPGVSSINGVAIEWRDTGYDVGIDNINYTLTGSVAIPEPSTWGLFSGGLAALGILLRRQRKS